MISPVTLSLIDVLPTAPRNREVLRRRLAGESLQAIGDPLNLTRERVRQIMNKSVSLLPIDVIPEVYEELRRINGHGEHSKSRQKKVVAEVKRKLVRHFKIGHFDREYIQSLIQEVDVRELTDIELCSWLYSEHNIKRFAKYLRCPGCTGILPLSDFSPATRDGSYQTSYCRACNTKRVREHYRKNENHRAYCARYQKENGNRSRIYLQRNYLKELGRLDEMPPLPPIGIKDSKIPRYNIGKNGQGGGWALWWRNATPEDIAERSRKASATIKKTMAAKRKNVRTSL